MSFGNSAGISFSGLASGLDTNSIISQLVQLERLPVQRLQNQAGRLQAQKDAYSSFRTQLQGLNTAIGAFNAPNAFNGTSVTSSKTDALTVSSSGNASQGIFDVKINQLATTEKLSSRNLNSPTEALGLTGQFRINNVDVEVVATDTLNQIATKINEKKLGAVASVINGGNGRTYLTLTSDKSGAENKVMVGGTNSVLQGLGFQAEFKDTIPNGFRGPAVASGAALLKDSGAFGNRTSYTLSINGRDSTFDLSTATWEDLRSELEKAGYSATMEPASPTGQRLQVTSGDGTFNISDPEGMLVRLGIRGNGTTLVDAKDAKYSVDGIEMTSATNQVTGVIGGVTLNLNQADPATTIKVTVSRDVTSATNRVKDFMAAFNRVNAFVRDNSKFDNETFRTGILFGDNVSQQVQSVLGNSIFSQIQNLQGPYGNLTQLGFGIADNGDLELNEATLRTALESNPNAVAEMFQSTGRSANPNLIFVNGGNKTRPSTTTGFDVNITRAATKATYTGSLAATSANRGGEELSFGGQGFGSSGYKLQIRAGASLADIVQQVNNDSTLKEKVVASIEGGKLKFEAKSWGSAASFTVFSNQSAATDNSGVGVAGQGAAASGLDIEGTINGAAATGSGQFLLGSTGDTEGLQIQYTGTATGNVGSMVFTRGVSGLLADNLETYLNSTGGLLQTGITALDQQIEDLQAQVTRVNERATRKEAELRARFLAMEQAMQAAQSQQQRMQSILNGSR